MSGDYKKDLETDINDLENEWQGQPGLYMFYAELHANAIEHRDRVKEHLESLDGRIIQEIIAEEGGKKPADSVLKGMVVNDKKHIDKFEELLAANKEVNLMTSAKVAFEHRKKQLENLVSLLISGHHADPKLKKEIKDKKGAQTRKQHEEALNTGNKRLHKRSS